MAYLEVQVAPLTCTVQEAVALVLDGARPAPRYLAHCGAVLVLAIDAGIYRLGMLELAIATHCLRGTEPTGTPGAVRVRE